MAKIICVPGSGDPFRPDNHISRARLEHAAQLWEEGDAIAIFGRQQAGLPNSEAVLGADYIKQHRPTIPVSSYVLNEDVKSTAETARAIAIYYGKYSQYQWVVITNWPYLKRTRALVNHHLLRLLMKDKDNPIAFHACGGTLKPYYAERGWHAVPWWLKNVLLREILASIKAMIDPDDTKLNQTRASAKRFSA